MVFYHSTDVVVEILFNVFLFLKKMSWKEYEMFRCSPLMFCFAGKASLRQIDYGSRGSKW